MEIPFLQKANWSIGIITGFLIILAAVVSLCKALFPQLPIPTFPGFNRRTLIVKPPKPEEIYFDDSLIEKISSEEAESAWRAL